MDSERQALLARLYRSGLAHDDAEPNRRLRFRNLEPDAALLLTIVLRAASARRVVEIGTSNGYSAIWLADAVRDTGGQVSTVDVEEWPELRANLAEAAVVSFVDVIVADGGAYLASLPDGSVDLLFLDAERVEYPSWWPHPVRVLRPGAVLAIDNVLSHPDEVAPFLALLARGGGFTGTTVPVGKGLYLAWRHSPVPA